MTTAATATKVFAARIGRIEVSATMAVTAEAAKLRAQGAKLVDFGAGEPHFATPRHIKDAAIEAINENFTRYTVVSGIPEVRKAIVERHASDFGSDYAPDEAVFTTGGKLALFNAIQVLVDHGDEVILPVPYWVSYKDIIQYGGGKVVYLETARPRTSTSRPTPSRRPSRRAPRPSSSIRLPTPPALSSPLLIWSASCALLTSASSISSSTSATSTCNSPGLGQRRILHRSQGAPHRGGLAVQDLRHDRLARRLRTWPEAHHCGYDQAAESVDFLYSALRPEGRRRRAQRFTGMRLRDARRLSRSS